MTQQLKPLDPLSPNQVLIVKTHIMAYNFMQLS